MDDPRKARGEVIGAFRGSRILDRLSNPERVKRFPGTFTGVNGQRRARARQDPSQPDALRAMADRELPLAGLEPAADLGAA